MSFWSAIETQVSKSIGVPFSIKSNTSIGGGCINRAHLVSDGQQSFFVKLNSASLAHMFAAEAAGLEEIAQSQSIRVPRVLCHGIADETAFLALEHIDMGHGNGVNNDTFGHQLAQMHRCTRETFGWNRDNTIGSTPQINTPTARWVDFWRDHRLRFQLNLAAQQGYGGHLTQRGEKLAAYLDDFFDGTEPAAALLHGDLWSGNYGATASGQPIIFDPAVYFGDREADLAMTELFGGFSPRFYAAYREAFALNTGYNTRKTLYNLYHILNHVNLFGGSYLSQAQSMISQLLSEIR